MTYKEIIEKVKTGISGMSKISKWHNQAMICVEEIIMAKEYNKISVRIMELTYKALEYELKAIKALDGFTIEPTYSILHYSAAQLALDLADILNKLGKRNKIKHNDELNMNIS